MLAVLNSEPRNSARRKPSSTTLATLLFHRSTDRHSAIDLLLQESSPEDHVRNEKQYMIRYQIRGGNLYDAHLHTIAKTKGGTIFDGNNQRIGSIRGDELFDTDGRKIVTVRGSNIYDSDNAKVGSFADVQGSIKGAVEGILHVAFWYCFVR